MELQDKRIKCVNCGREFVFTVGQQLYFREKGFTNEPKRCKDCKIKQMPEFSSPRPSSKRADTPAICSACGKETTVPFVPTQGRPVLCRDCFQERRLAGSTGRAQRPRPRLL